MSKKIPIVLFTLITSLFFIYSEKEYSFTYKSDFTKFAAGSDGSPEWFSSTVGWEINNGIYNSNDQTGSFALLDISPQSKTITIESKIVITKTTGVSWKSSGIAIYMNNSNYWHLALIESPDDKDKKHSVELSEMLDNKWLSQNNAGTKLTGISYNNENFIWEYNHPYILKLEFSPDKIIGTVNETDGTEKIKIGYKFDNTAVNYGIPGLTNGGFNTEFYNFSTKTGSPAGKVNKNIINPYKNAGYEKIRIKSTGYFQVKKENDSWWLFDPEGLAFFAVGADAVNYNGAWCEKLGYSPYNRNVIQKFSGNEENWANDVLSRFTKWGFNSLGVNSSNSVRHKNIPHTLNISLGTKFSSIDYITPKTTWTGFPNVFSPKFEQFCNKTARLFCETSRNDPWLIGYYIDNELEWFPHTTKGILYDTISLPANNTAKIAFVNFLKTRYPKVKDFNKVWETNIKNFEELLNMNNFIPVNTANIKNDETEFIRLIAKKYFEITTKAIRKNDPNHLILGCRFAGRSPEIWDIAGIYCDVVSVNCYRKLDLDTGIPVDGFIDDLKNWYEKAKKPLIITEWSFPALDAGLPCKYGAGQRVPTQKERSFAFKEFQKILFKTPFIVGSYFFKWVDQPALGVSSTFPEDSNYGLVNEFDIPYPELTQTAQAINNNVYQIHSKNIPELSITTNPFSLKNSGLAAGSGIISIITDGNLSKQQFNIAAGKQIPIDFQKEFVSIPGGHFISACAELDNSPSETCDSISKNSIIFYSAGTPWNKNSLKGKTIRIPIVIANPLNNELKNVPITLNLKNFSNKITGKNFKLILNNGNNEEAVPYRIINSENNEKLLLIQPGIIEPYKNITLFLYQNIDLQNKSTNMLNYTKLENGFEIDNGIMKFEKNNPEKGNAFDSIKLNGIELGNFIPDIKQVVSGKSLWVKPDKIDEISVNRAETSIILDITFSYTKNSPVNDLTKSFRTKSRFVIYYNKPYFTSQFLWLENTDSSDWEFSSYYHYLTSNIGKKQVNDLPEDNYWQNDVEKIKFGVFCSDQKFKVRYWKDDSNNEHPDAYFEINKSIKPKEFYSDNQSKVYILGIKDMDGNAWKQFINEIQIINSLPVKIFPAENYY